LTVVKDLAGRQAGELAETLAGAARVLMSKLQELASSSLSLGLPGDPLSQVCCGKFESCYIVIRVLGVKEYVSGLSVLQLFA
jgi:hypothetical protein